MTNLDLDHHTSFASLEEVRELFAEWVGNVPASGTVILGDGVDLPAHAPVQRFGVADGADWHVSGLEAGDGGTSFWLSTPDGTPCRRASACPGVHNAVNAAGAVAALHAAGADIPDAVAALRDFTGAGRRYELRGSRDGYTVVDDYAHHPTELRAVIAAARAQAPRRLLVVFQPHLYSRTSALADEFGRALGGADEAIVTEIYPAREQPVSGVTAKLVVDAVTRVPAGNAGGLPAPARGRCGVPAQPGGGGRRRPDRRCRRCAARRRPAARMTIPRCVSADFPIARLTTVGTGGPARWFADPAGGGRSRPRRSRGQPGSAWTSPSSAWARICWSPTRAGTAWC